MLPITQLEYLDDDGRSPFGLWLEHLDDVALMKVTIALQRLSNGNTSNAKSIGSTTSDGPPDMPLTKDFKETVLKDMRERKGFREAMLQEGISCLLAGELDLGKEVLRDYINATMGFEKLSRKVDLPVKSLMRMLGPNGNPQAKNLFAVIAALQKDAGIELQVMAAE